MGSIGKGLWPTLGGILLLLLLLAKVANSCGLLDSNPQGDQELQEENDKPIPYEVYKNTLYYEVTDYDNPNIKSYWTPEQILMNPLFLKEPLILA